MTRQSPAASAHTAIAWTRTHCLPVPLGEDDGRQSQIARCAEPPSPVRGTPERQGPAASGQVCITEQTRAARSGTIGAITGECLRHQDHVVHSRSSRRSRWRADALQGACCRARQSSQSWVDERAVARRTPRVACIVVPTDDQSRSIAMLSGDRDLSRREPAFNPHRRSAMWRSAARFGGICSGLLSDSPRKSMSAMLARVSDPGQLPSVSTLHDVERPWTADGLWRHAAADACRRAKAC